MADVIQLARAASKSAPRRRRLNWPLILALALNCAVWFLVWFVAVHS